MTFIQEPFTTIVGTDINEFMRTISLDDYDLYFHNLKFDGEFIFNWLFKNGFSHEKGRIPKHDYSFTTLIAGSGQFYKITIKFHSNRKINIYDSLKILPFKVEEIAKAFDLEEQKLEIDYSEDREPGHILTPEEEEYVKHDTIIVAKALSILFSQGLTKITQAGNAFNDYKKRIGSKAFKRWFPPPEYDSDIRQAYRGGWTYLNPKFKNRTVTNGIRLDTNSMYPWAMMYCNLPWGEPIFFDGEYKHDSKYPLYIQQLRCQFEIKKNHVPTIQVKSSPFFAENEWVESSGNEDVVLCLTSVDLKLFKDHYNLYNVEYINGWKFRQAQGAFSDYITYWMGVKVKASKEGNKAMRTLAKLMLNALYGKFGTNPRTKQKYPYQKEDGTIGYRTSEVEERDPIYVPVAAFITAYARDKVIRAAQSCYKNFAYADTDSLHLFGITEMPDLEIDDNKLGAWKLEAKIEKAKFLRQKTYVEVVDGNLEVTCAGLPKACHKYVTFDNFTYDATYNTGKLLPKHVPGGIVLKNVPFKIKG